VRRTGFVLSVMAVALIATRVAAAPPSQQPVFPSPHAPAPASTLWDEPLGDEGVKIASPSASEAGFRPDIPDVAAEPAAIFSTNPGRAPVTHRAIAWAFSHPSYGQFIITEDARDATQPELEEPALHAPGCEAPDANGDVRCYGSGFSIATIRGGTRALVSAGDTVTAVTFFEPLDSKNASDFATYRHPVLTVTVMGPAASFSVDEAIAIAEKI
jgi:hypothetical protein